MERINVSDSMASAAGKINAAFAALGSPQELEVIGENDTMQTIAGKVSRNFAKVTSTTMQAIDDDDTMSAISAKMLNNFNVVEPEWEERSVSVSFLHASDPHGQTSFVEQMEDRIDYVDFALITGDIKPYNSTVGLENYYNPSTDAGSLKNLKESGKLLVCAGNHDSNDSWASGQTVHTNHRMTSWMHSLLGSSVNWGDRADQSVNEPHYSSYYYKDFQAGRNVLRLIVLDQYEFDAVAGNTNGVASNPTLVYAPVYTQAQFTWLINLLKSTPSTYHVAIALHQSPMCDNAYGDSIKLPTADNYADAPISKLFISEKLAGTPYNEYVSDGPTQAFWSQWNNVVLDIIKAYLDSSHLERTFLNVRESSSAEFTIDADFTDTDPAYFCGYIQGHLHYDLITWMPSSYDEHYTQTYGNNLQRQLYPKQLTIGITAADSQVETYGKDDLDDTASGTRYRMNKVTIVFATDNSVPQVIVERIGTKLTDGGRNRDKIRFWINDEQTVDIPS